jgi:hypothetical protein
LITEDKKKQLKIFDQQSNDCPWRPVLLLFTQYTIKQAAITENSVSILVCVLTTA